jgi:gliding motility associated protien GldN
MKKVLFFLVGLFFFMAITTDSNAQLMTGIYEQHINQGRKPVPYQFVREADVMWSKVIWRRLNMTEKMNLPLYYPTEEMEDRKSLIQLIMFGIKNKSLTPFSSDEFTTQYTMKDIDNRFGAEVDTTYDVDPETGETIPLITKRKADLSEVKELLIKEMWYFDKQRSVMEVRIIGMAPIRVFYRDDDPDQETARYRQLFWIYYPEARNIFASQPVYNEHNQSSQITFDDIFFKRKFSGYIFKESNVYDNRLIQQYTTGLDVLLQSERIKEEIFNFEHDLWEF